MRKIIKQTLTGISPALADKCSEFWDQLSPVVKGKMRAKGATKYLVRGVCPGLSGRFNYYNTMVYFPKGSVLFRLTCDQGAWEPETVNWLCKLAQPDKLFIDVGANIGLISVPVLRNVPRSRVLSFEPSPNSSPYLQRTRLESPFRDRWEIVPKVAGEQAGNVQFWHAAPSKGAWDGLQDTKQAGAGKSTEIAQTTVDLEWRRLGCPQVSCMKIDVEGAESKVLQGGQEMVRHERPHILLEWSQVNLKPYGVDSQFLLDYAKTHNYDVVAMPTLNRVLGGHSLKLHMLHTESFLLVPKADENVRPCN